MVTSRQSLWIFILYTIYRWTSPQSGIQMFVRNYSISTVTSSRKKSFVWLASRDVPFRFVIYQSGKSVNAFNGWDIWRFWLVVFVLFINSTKEFLNHLNHFEKYFSNKLENGKNCRLWLSLGDKYLFILFINDNLCTFYIVWVVYIDDNVHRSASNQENDITDKCSQLNSQTTFNQRKQMIRLWLFI